MIQIEKQIDELTFERWTFTWIDNHIYLDGYSMLRKESKRHKNYNVLKKYSRLMSRDNTIMESDVPFTTEIKAEAYDQFVSKIKVRKWSER
jgi:hypothetical protein